MQLGQIRCLGFAKLEKIFLINLQYFGQSIHLVYQFTKLLVTNLKLLTTMDILLYWMYCKRRSRFFQCRSRYWMPGIRHWQKVSTFARIQFPEKLTIWILEHLPFAIKESYFIFNGNFYKEHERKAMDPPFQPVFPNVFMINFEKYRLQTCPPTRKLHFHPWWWWWWWWCFCFSYFSCTKYFLSSGVALNLDKSTTRS